MSLTAQIQLATYCIKLNIVPRYLRVEAPSYDLRPVGAKANNMLRSKYIFLLSTLALLPMSACEDIPDLLPVESAGQPGGCPGCTTSGSAANTTDTSDSSNSTSSVDSTNATSNNTTENPDNDFTDEQDRCVDPNDPNAPRVEVNEDLIGSHTWSCNKIYVLNKIITVRQGVLQIRPGTTIKGKHGSALIIEKNAALYAKGVPWAPIVFTSDKPVGQRSRGDWGGLVFLGRARTNAGENLPAEGFATPRTFGGNKTEHSCGILQYVRVEWAGFELSPGQELNGISFYACGSATQVDHVQSHMSLDDGIEWFGGGFDASHIVVTGAKDDALDFDLGFRGQLQSVFIHQDPSMSDHAVEVSSGSAINPHHVTRPQIANLTHIASDSSEGRNEAEFRISQGAQLHLYNSITLNNHPFVFGLSDDASAQAMIDGHSIVAGSIMNTVSGDQALVNVASEVTPALLQEAIAAIKEVDRGNRFEQDVSLPSMLWGSPFIRPPKFGIADRTGVRPPEGFVPNFYCGAVDPRSWSDWTQEDWVSYAVN